MLEKELVCQNEIHPYYSSTKHDIYHGWKWVRHTEDDFVLGVTTRYMMAWINCNLAFLTCEKISVFAQIRAKSLFWKSYESALEIQNELVKNHYVLISVILEAGFTNTAILLQKHPSLNAW